jgi:hypothetical protein
LDFYAKGIYTIFFIKGEVYFYNEPGRRKTDRKPKKKEIKRLPLLRTNLHVLLELPVRILHLPGLYV